jgi:hypothetical protein
MQDLARLFILLGIVILGIGLILLLASRLPFLGHLPGDIRIQADGFSCFLPLATSLVLSILLSLLLTIIGNLLQRR